MTLFFTQIKTFILSNQSKISILKDELYNQEQIDNFLDQKMYLQQEVDEEYKALREVIAPKYAIAILFPDDTDKFNQEYNDMERKRNEMRDKIEVMLQTRSSSFEIALDEILYEEYPQPSDSLRSKMEDKIKELDMDNLIEFWTNCESEYNKLITEYIY